MASVTPSADCGNSPKNQFAQSVAIAIELRDIEKLREALAGQATVIEGAGRAAQRDAYLDAVSRIKAPRAIVIQHVATHGKVGFVSGQTVDSDDTERRFCYRMTFTTAKGNYVATLESFA